MKSKGATLIELMAVLFVMGAAGIGLAAVFVIGWDTWQKAECKIRLQQNGSFALQECAKAVQGAQSIYLSDNGLTATLPALDSLPARIAKIQHSRSSLYLNERKIIPFHQSEQVSGIQIRLDVFETVFDSLLEEIRIDMQLSGIFRQRVIETMSFNTALTSRNLK